MIIPPLSRLETKMKENETFENIAIHILGKICVGALCVGVSSSTTFLKFIFSAVSQSKADPYCRSLESITDVGDGILERSCPRIPAPIPSTSQSESTSPAHVPVSRAGSMDSVLFPPQPANQKKETMKRPESVDRAFPRPRASYIQATDGQSGQSRSRDNSNRARGRSAEKKPSDKSSLR